MLGELDSGGLMMSEYLWKNLWKNLWDMYGIFMGHVWDMYGIFKWDVL